jgi:hypothetical protein
MKRCNRLQLITITEYDYPISGKNIDEKNIADIFDERETV